MLGGPADLLSLLYMVAAAYTLWQLPSRWRALTDDDYTLDDKNLAGRVGFLLLTPVGVLIHELSHMVAATLLAIVIIPVCFYVVERVVRWRRATGVGGPELLTPVTGGGG